MPFHLLLCSFLPLNRLQCDLLVDASAIGGAHSHYKLHVYINICENQLFDSYCLFVNIIFLSLHHSYFKQGCLMFGIIVI